jgi:hypothetical protein
MQDGGLGRHERMFACRPDARAVRDGFL